MAQDNKVVSLKTQHGAGRFALPTTLVRLRDASGKSLDRLLSEFFDSADDALFNMADKAGSNQEQTAYFDAMRELRMRRKHLTLSMLQWISRAFNELGRFDPLPSSGGLNDVDKDTLTLMDHGDLEQQVAIENMITKLRNHHTDGIRLLAARVSNLVPEIRLEDRQMPLSPEVICTGLGEACGDLDIDIRAKLIVLKLFDRLLIGRLDALYQEANRLLVAEGVLPELTRAAVAGRGQSRKPLARKVPAAEAPGALHAAAAGDDESDHATFTQLSELLHQDGNDRPWRQTSGGQKLDTRSLMERIGQIQLTDAGSGPAGEVVPLSIQLQQALGKQGSESWAVQQVDSDVINLVSMLFEFILEDRQLSPVMKALIGRLQIPVLKVALCDRNFFNRGGHPARKLLNELALAGIGWTEKSTGQRDPLREKVEYVVNRLLNEFSDNIELFSELLTEFSHFMDLDRRRRELVEQRLKDAEEGRARQEQAAQVVDVLLKDALDGAEVPSPVESLLLEPWRKYLQWVMLREGEDSDLWISASSLTHQLVWSVDPRPVDETTRGELLKSIPGIVDALRSGLQGISWDPFAIDTAIRDLELTHVDVLQQLVSVREKQPEPEQVPVEPASKPQVTEAVAAPVVETQIASDPVQPGPVAEPAAHVQSEPVTEDFTPEARWMQRADRMAVGSWVELQNGGQKLRCKLAALIKSTGKYIFVNRNGAKVAEYFRLELAAALAEGEVTLLDDGLIFDRALESIIDNLRHSRRD
ncbi:DUF1631 domain-containing protein [Marinobacter sp.]|uniref:DUF1631 domain-containing protein n=1 Tax=Marinobacter sp. TaxID=50741 RepID=UPI0038514712